ncbi:MAG: T9SS type A sorting domain-containing protein [Chitinivibrionales bacterium]|nr:T9SS type A sorting domain-containing protein [Chitinivibrionales bacterium]
MNQKIRWIPVLLLALFFSGWATPSTIPSEQTMSGQTMSHRTPSAQAIQLAEIDQGYKITVHIPLPQIADTVLETGNQPMHFTALTVNGYAPLSEYGTPSLPARIIHCAIENGSAQLTDITVETTRIHCNHPLMPLQPSQDYCMERLPVPFKYQKQAYSQTSTAEPIRIHDRYTYRNQAAISIIIRPVLSYDPLERTIVSATTITATLKTKRPTEVRNGNSATFDAIMRDIFINFQSPAGRSLPSQSFQGKEKYILITENSSSVKDLIEYRLKEFDVETVSASSIGNTPEAYRTFLKEKNASYVLLVGGATGFPYYAYMGPLEQLVLSYSSFTFPSIETQLPDMALGLFLGTDAECANTIRKTMENEKKINNAPKSFCAIGGNTQKMGDQPPNHCDVIVRQMYDGYMKNKGYSIVENYMVNQPKGSTSSIISSFNSGVHFVNYNGHGAADRIEWLRLTDASSFANSYYPYFLICACMTGTFTQAEYMCQKFAGHAKGPAAVIGAFNNSSMGQHPLNRGLFRALFEKGISRYGAALASAVCYLVKDSVAANCDNELKKLAACQYHLFGDPAALTMEEEKKTAMVKPQPMSAVSTTEIQCRMVNNTLHLTLPHMPKYATVSLFSSSGACVLRSRVAQTQSRQITVSTLVMLASGCYIVRVHTNQATLVKRWVVIP